MRRPSIIAPDPDLVSFSSFSPSSSATITASRQSLTIVRRSSQSSSVRSPSHHLALSPVVVVVGDVPDASPTTTTTTAAGASSSPVGIADAIATPSSTAVPVWEARDNGGGTSSSSLAAAGAGEEGRDRWTAKGAVGGLPRE